MLGQIHEGDGAAAHGGGNAIHILNPEPEILSLIGQLVPRRGNFLSHGVLTRLDIVLASRVSPLELQLAILVGDKISIDAVGQTLEVEGGGANAVTVLVHLVDYTLGRLVLAILDSSAAIDRGCGLLGRVVGSADSDRIALGIGYIAFRSRSLFEIEGLGGLCHTWNLVISPLICSRCKLPNRVLTCRIQIDSKCSSSQSISTLIGLLNLNPTFAFFNCRRRHCYDHGLDAA